MKEIGERTLHCSCGQRSKQKRQSAASLFLSRRLTITAAFVLKRLYRRGKLGAQNIQFALYCRQEYEAGGKGYGIQPFLNSNQIFQKAEKFIKLL